MVDKELLKACVINPWSVTPRMMLIDSMIENGFEEFKAMESFELPPTSQCLPSIYGGGVGGGLGNSSGVGRGGGYGGSGYGGGSGDSSSGYGIGLGRGRGIGKGYRDK